MKEPVAVARAAIPERQSSRSPSSHPPPASFSGAHDESAGAPSRHLWVGNVAVETPESVVRDMFGKFGELDSVTVYPQRQYAFVNFRKQEDAERAKEGLHGAHIAGQPLRIEFAKGARPNRHLAVAGIALSVTKEMLEAEFQKYGAIEEFKLLKDKSSLMVDYFKTDDAIAAVEALNGKRFGDDVLRVDYRSLASKRGPASGPSAPSSAPRGGGGNKDDTPSEVLWIGLPANAKFDEETLHRLFLPYGEVDRVKLFASRSYCFVEFRSVKEAALAKNALSGKPINGHRLHIEFSTSEVGPVDGKDGASEPNEAIAKKSRVSPAEQSGPRLGSPFLPVQGPDSWGWHGVIAKGGTVVCQARGFLASGKVETLLIPEVVNCTSRTDLDRLADHIYPTAEFPVVLFMPARDVDLMAYHDFLRYLRENHRAGVVKLGDATNLFLVPPSPFAEKVLKVTRSDCIIGMVLNFRSQYHHHVQLQQQQQQHHHHQQKQDHFQTSQPPPPANLPPELLAWSMFPPATSTAPSAMAAPLSVTGAAAPAPVAAPPGFSWPGPGDQQQQQQSVVVSQQQPNAVVAPQLPIEQLAQLTSLLQQTSSQQAQAQQPAWAPSAAIAQFHQGDPEQFQRTLALAAQMLEARKKQ
ncbi:flowering time control protein FPA-like [Selaginella moellendorffii]|uniref:flowering time control protein FPA-like n=1 Tax=Selaginella moellendorffii TaxID=88036 RepID=UPI000D1C3D47|nr:flowering time control protein FPA-like [Selaginella moellendorffii]|eukprot:XP_024531725.1 flowering time control protein FPA-like [Selaginella moellendorffii]